jgi:mannonate dehydratase
MKETWRWFGPQDPISLDQIKQTGASGIVTALHDRYSGEAWPLHDVLKRKGEIEAAGLVWSVVESIPVHNSIKLRSGPYRQFIEAWKQSLLTIAEAGTEIVCYNFMPVLDWTRTELRWRLPSTGYALRFDMTDFAAYDLFILRRKDAERDYESDRVASAHSRFKAMSDARISDLEVTIIAGLPGGEGSYNRESLRGLLAEYAGMSAEDMRANLCAFLAEVAPVAREVGIRLGIHPDDPPWQLFGIPRVVSTTDDARAILAGCDTLANGLTFCVGSYGARSDNDLLAMIREFGSKIHFVHLRQVMREADGSFYEAEHLRGSSPMVPVIHELLKEQARRLHDGRSDHLIPMRPDHGHLLADDIDRKVNPGYSLIGRLKGLAELRGVVHGLKSAFPELAESCREEESIRRTI